MTMRTIAGFFVLTAMLGGCGYLYEDQRPNYTRPEFSQLNLNLISLSDRKACTSASVPAANCVAHKASPAGR